MNKWTLLGAVAVQSCLAVASVSAFNINLIYPSGSLFSATHDSSAKAAINAAAYDISTAITTNLAAINNDVLVGTNGNATTSFNWYYQYGDPSSGVATTINSATIASNTVTIYVGARSLAGSTLGFGGPSGAGFQSQFSYSLNNPGQIVGATANAEAQSEVAYKRGGGPVIGTLAGGTTIEGVPVSYSVDFGIAYGSLALDWDGNNNGAKDSDLELDNYWHFDHLTDPAAGKNDLYSVALHEILHAIGIGASESWQSKVSGSSWTGAYVVDLMESGAGLINPARDHITEGTMSTNAYDGTPQEAVMDPSITQGSRKYLTALDLAFLRDIGYSTINWVTAPSSPADFDHDGDVDDVDLATWRGSYGVGAAGDTDGDNDTDGRDFLIWQRQYTGAILSTAINVPEPAGVTILVSGYLLLLGCRRRTR